MFNGAMSARSEAPRRDFAGEHRVDSPPSTERVTSVAVGVRDRLFRLPQNSPLLIRLLSVLAICAPLEGFAQDAADNQFNVVSLQAEATREIPNDRLSTSLAAEAEGREPAALSGLINRRMTDALSIAKSYPAVELKSGSYQIIPVYGRDRKIEGWRARQDLQIQSGDFAAASELIGKLQGLLSIKDLSLGLTVQARRGVENALVAEAIAAFQQRAAIVKDALKGTSYRVRRLDINTAGFSPPPRTVAFASRASAEVPALEAGSSQVTVQVSGTIQIQ
jgi:predicted secreted protein